MIRFLAAMLAIVGVLSMAPVVHASGSAMERWAIADGGTASVMASGSRAPCVSGNPCMLACALCFPAPTGQAGDDGLAESRTNASAGWFASFDLSWRLYRPPKAG